MAAHGFDNPLEGRQVDRIGLPAIFGAFFRLGVTSFGGGTAGWLYREIVERRHWISDTDFLSAAGLSHIMPGSGGVNLTVQVGLRLRGGPGAVAAVLGLLSGPLAMLALAVGYARVGQSATVHAVLDGIAAGAIGLTFRDRTQARSLRSCQCGSACRDCRDRTLRRRAALAADTHGFVSCPGQHRPGAIEAAQRQCLTTSELCWH
jgi:hypothetical protein